MSIFSLSKGEGGRRKPPKYAPACAVASDRGAMLRRATPGTLGARLITVLYASTLGAWWRFGLVVTSLGAEPG